MQTAVVIGLFVAIGLAVLAFVLNLTSRPGKKTRGPEGGEG